MQYNFVFQLTFYPFQDKINKLPFTVYNHDTVQIHSRRGSHSVANSDTDFRYRLDTRQTRKPFYFSFRFNYQLQVQIHSRHGGHSVTYPDPSYNTDTIQIRMSFCHSSRYSMDIPQTWRSFYYSFKRQ